MSIQIQLRRDNTSNWTSNNPILAIGEIGLEYTDISWITLQPILYGKKIGNGNDDWNTLLYDYVNGELVNHLPYLTSGHTGTANKIFGSDASGVAKEYALTDFETQNATTSDTSGTITLAKQTVTTLTTTLTNAHTLTIIPELPTVFTNRNYSEVVLTVGATAPSITWSAPTGVTLDWKDGEPTSGLAINKRHSIMYDWESETMCIVRREEF